MNFDALVKGKKAWDQFAAAHPQFPAFFQEVKRRGVPEGAMIDIAVRYPDGTDLKAGLKVRASDLELLKMLRELVGDDHG